MSRATTVSLPLPIRVQQAVVKIAARTPAAVYRALSSWMPVNAAGERLSADIAAVAFATGKIPGMGMYHSSPVTARVNLDHSSALMAQTLPPFAVEEDLVIDGPSGPIGATRYRFAESTPRGLVVFFHGGGFVVGSRASHDGAVRNLAIDAGVDVLSIDYRLAPENPFPAAVDDAVAAFRFAVEKAPEWGVPADRIGVAGDSAGGNLAAVVCQQVRGDDVVPRHQLLIYPVTDLVGATASHDEFATGFFLTKSEMDWFTDQYVPDVGQRTDPRASPLRATDLTGLPPAHVVVAGFDPLRDEGIAYADALRAAGVPVTFERAGGMIHGFVNMTLLSRTARDIARRMGDAVSSALA
ncbi:alpha/beta hydrolase [Gordonia sp. TBRC 11910]|uniref:Alpha/beta hydrolase n=1 Tax=Gordonia asplenii TaxID=2725283 RepID=A0A848L8P7_9ACTN|nr:alpha/beta hydrolase [Gordonia asplenii]